MCVIKHLRHIRKKKLLEIRRKFVINNEKIMTIVAYKCCTGVGFVGQYKLGINIKVCK